MNKFNLDFELLQRRNSFKEISFNFNQARKNFSFHSKPLGEIAKEEHGYKIRYGKPLEILFKTLGETDLKMKNSISLDLITMTTKNIFEETQSFINHTVTMLTDYELMPKINLINMAEKSEVSYIYIYITEYYKRDDFRYLNTLKIQYNKSINKEIQMEKDIFILSTLLIINEQLSTKEKAKAYYLLFGDFQFLSKYQKVKGRVKPLEITHLKDEFLALRIILHGMLLDESEENENEKIVQNP